MDSIKGISAVTRLSTGALLAAGAMFTPIVYGSVIYTSRDSSLSAVVCDSSGANCTTQNVDDKSFNDFSKSVGTQDIEGYASQQSHLSQSGISVTLFAGQGQQDPETASSIFSVGFTLDTPTSFRLSGNSFYQLNGGIAEFTTSWPCLNPPLGNISCSTDTQQLNTINTSVSDHGVLQPGAYTFFVQALAGGPAIGISPPTSGATATLSLQPVPLPASGPLLAVGLAVSALVRRRRSRLQL